MSYEEDNAKAFVYIREKINQLLGVMGTYPLKPEELDDKTLIDLDPIGIIAESFKQILKHHDATIKELELAKNEIRTIFDSIFTSILVVDQDNKVKDFNQNAKEKFFPGKANEDIYDNNVEQVCNCDRSFFEKLYNNPGKPQELNYNNNIFTVTMNMIGNVDNEHYLSIINLFDITGQKKVEKELNMHRDNLEQLVRDRTTDYRLALDEANKANSAKSEFLSRMSHELRTPLNAILGFSQVLDLNKGLDEDQKSNVKEILKAGYHLLNLVNDVLDLAAIEAGKLDVEIREVSVNSVLTQSLALIKQDAKSKGIEIVDNISNKNYNVLADPTRLKQALLNILSNAVKYNQLGGRVTLEIKAVDNDFVRISISDTGKGLTEDEAKYLYTPFDRINASKNIEGAGIGLIITKHIVELMNGEIGFNSTIGQGSTFWIDLKKS